MMKSIGREKAIELYDSNWWELCDEREITEFQLFVEELCCPFEIFHAALEKTIERPVWTHELGLNLEGIQREFLGEKAPPTMEEILNLIPEEKRIVVAVGDASDLDSPDAAD